MINIISTTCIVVAVLSVFSEKKYLNPITSFLLLWAIILKLSTLQLFDLNYSDDSIYILISIGLFCFVVGYYITRLFVKKSSVVLRCSNNYNEHYILRYRLLYFLGTITILLYLRDLISVIPYLLGGNGLAGIRSLAQNTSGTLNSNKSVVETFLRVMIVSPYTMALQVVVAIDFWMGERNKLLLYMNICILLLRSLTDGSRVILVYFIIHLLVGFTFSNHKNLRVSKNKGIKNKLLVSLLLFVGGFMLYKATMSRSGSNVVRYAYYYFSMEPFMLGTWNKLVDSSGLVGYGMASINGFIFVVMYFIKNVFMINYPQYWYSIYSIIEATDSNWQVITGSGTQANAYVSVFWFLYLDGKIWGIIIGMAIYGAISAIVYWMAIQQTNAKNVSIYALILQGLFFSFVRMQFANVYYAIAFLFILFVAYRRKNEVYL